MRTSGNVSCSILHFTCACSARGLPVYLGYKTAVHKLSPFRAASIADTARLSPRYEALAQLVGAYFGRALLVLAGVCSKLGLGSLLHCSTRYGVTACMPAGVRLTFIDANHCPGAAMVIAEPVGKPPVLHTGMHTAPYSMLALTNQHANPMQTVTSTSFQQHASQG